MGDSRTFPPDEAVGCDTGPASPELFRGGLKNALEQFEECLESPVVPGELPGWSAALHQACTAAKTALEREVKEVHADQLKRLANKDPDLLTRVAQLRTEDEEIHAEYERYHNTVQRMCEERADIAEPHERKADEGVKTLVDDGLALIIRIRKQERALETWFSEAYQRDTGSGD